MRCYLIACAMVISLPLLAGATSGNSVYDATDMEPFDRFYSTLMQARRYARAGNVAEAGMLAEQMSDLMSELMHTDVERARRARVELSAFEKTADVLLDIDEILNRVSGQIAARSLEQARNGMFRVDAEVTDLVEQMPEFERTFEHRISELDEALRQATRAQGPPMSNGYLLTSSLSTPQHDAGLHAGVFAAIWTTEMSYPRYIQTSFGVSASLQQELGLFFDFAYAWRLRGPGDRVIGHFLGYSISYDFGSRQRFRPLDSEEAFTIGFVPVDESSVSFGPQYMYSWSERIATYVGAVGAVPVRGDFASLWDRIANSQLGGTLGLRVHVPMVF